MSGQGEGGSDQEGGLPGSVSGGEVCPAIGGVYLGGVFLQLLLRMAKKVP